MAWTAARTWVAGETVSASIMNTHVRDNLLETVPAKATAAGQIPYSTGGSAIAMLQGSAYAIPRCNAGGTAMEFIGGPRRGGVLGITVANRGVETGHVGPIAQSGGRGTVTFADAFSDTPEIVWTGDSISLQTLNSTTAIFQNDSNSADQTVYYIAIGPD